MTLNDLLKQGLIPKDCVPVTAEKTAILQDVEKSGYNVLDGTVIVAEGFTELVYSETKDVYYSINKQGKICRHDVRNKSCSIQTLKGKKLKTELNTNLKKREDVKNMAEQAGKTGLEGLNDIKFGDELNNIGAELGGEGTEKLTAFDEKEKEKNDEADAEKLAKQKERDAKKSKLDTMITSDTAGIQLADISVLAQFNRKNGAFMGYITQNDALVKFGTSTVIVKDASTKKPKLADNADPSVRNAVNRGQSIAGFSKENFVTETSLTVKQTTPGKVLGTIIAIPEGGNVSLADVFGEKTVKPDETKKDIRYLLLDNDESIQIISQLFNGRIHESQVTFGEQATDIDVKLKLVDTVDSENLPTVLKKFSMKPVKRSNKMTVNSYFPLKTFKTVSLSGTITEEQAADMAFSAFQHLYQTSLKSVGRKIDSLKASDKGLIDQDKDSKFSSKYFTVDVSSRVPLQIKPAFTPNKDEKLQNIEIPIKELKQGKSNNPTAKYVHFDCLGKLDSVDAKTLNPLSQAKAGMKFSVFFNAVGGEATINEDALRTIKPRRGSKNGKASSEVDSKTIRELLAAPLQGRDGSLKYEKGTTASMESLEGKLFNARS